jgi:two-component system nitrate/nitrite sensor histidine kinase NarX
LLEADEFVDLVDRFVASIETHLSYWTTILHGVQLFMLGLVVVTSVTTAYALHLFLLEPLNRLTAATGRIRRSEFDARVEIESHDEFGVLATGFNEMAAALQSSYRDLEERVARKTASLGQQKRRLESLYEITSLVAEASTLADLARGFARRITRIAGADAAALRWSDESNQRLILLASEGLPPAMVEESRCLHVGQCRCGVSATETGVRVIPVRGESPPQQTHCARAGFATVISVPVRSHQRMVGEINLFYREPRDHTPEESSLLLALASHLAAAIENLRLAAEARHAAVFQERTMLAQELHDSIAQSLAFLKIQVKLLRDALAGGGAAAIAAVVDEIDAGVRESYGDVRELLIHFRTRTDMEDVEQAIRATLAKFERQTALKAALTIRGDGMPLAPEVQIQVLHVIQEALSNVRKHSGATGVKVEVEQEPVWRFRVSDNGSGFELRAGAGDETHVGLRIMRERAQRVGAALEVRSTLGKGTEVILTLAQSELASAKGTAPESVSAGNSSEQGGHWA